MSFSEPHGGRQARDACARVLQYCLAMATCVLTCETCGGHQSFIIYEEELAGLHNGKPVSKHCLVCRATTNWVFASPEKRSGRDRRQGSDRRKPAP